MHAFVVLAGSTADGRGRRRAARRCCDEALDVWQTPVLGRRRGPGGRGVGPRRGRRLADYRGRQRQHARRRGVAGRRRRAGRPTRHAPAGCAARRCAPPSASCTAGRGSATGGCPSTSPPTGSRCPTTTATGRPTRSARTASRRAPVRVGAAGPAPPRGRSTDPPGWLLDDAVALFDAAASRGWAADGHDGFPYTLDWDDRPVVGARMHWVLCEAVAAATVLAEVTGEPRYRRARAPLAGARRGGCSPTPPPAAGTTS